VSAGREVLETNKQHEQTKGKAEIHIAVYTRAKPGTVENKVGQLSTEYAKCYCGKDGANTQDHMPLHQGSGTVRA
jgi:hypothetical protein